MRLNMYMMHYFMLQLGLGDGYPSEVTLYILSSNCTKFGAFVRSVSDLTIG